jgi:hypothetical protein
MYKYIHIPEGSEGMIVGEHKKIKLLTFVNIPFGG